MGCVGDDDELGAETVPPCGDRFGGVVGVEPADVFVAGLDDVCERDAALDSRARVLCCAEKGRSDVGVVADQGAVAELGDERGDVSAAGL